MVWNATLQKCIKMLLFVIFSLLIFKFTLKYLWLQQKKQISFFIKQHLMLMKLMNKIMKEPSWRILYKNEAFL